MSYISNGRTVVKVSRLAAKQQLTTLFPGVEKFTFQWFDDSPAKDKRKAKTVHGTFDECADFLIDANKAGCGIYVTVNHTTGTRRRGKDVDRVRYHFIEADEGAEPLDKIKAELQPRLVIESSPGHYHAYALIDDDLAQDLAGFPARQKKLAAYFKAGRESHDLARVLRLAGFVHQKNPSKPFQVRIVDDDFLAPVWTRDALDMLLDGIEVAKTERFERSETPAVDEDTAAIDWAINWFANDAPIAISDTENEQTGKKGNNTTYDVMCAARDQGVTEQTCLDLAYEHFNPRCEPEWDFDKLKEIVRNVYAYAQNTQGEKTATADFKDVEDDLTPKDKKDNERGAAERKQRTRDGGLDHIIASAVKMRTIDWIWDDHLAAGQHTAIAGVQGDGKSLLIYALAAAVSTGGKWPGTKQRAPRGKVIVFSAEDTDADVLVPRLAAAGANLDNIIIVKAVRDVSGKGKRKFNLQADINKLQNLTKSIGDVKLITFDPVSSYLGGEIDSHNNTELRDALDPITKLAEETGAAVVSITHFNKSAKGVSALNRVMGGAAFTAAPRAAFAVIRNAEDTSQRLFLPLKLNLMSEGAAYGMIYHINSKVAGKDYRDQKPITAPFVVWDGTTEITADEALAATQEAFKTDPPAVTKAKEFLNDILEKGPMLKLDVEEEAEGQSIMSSTLRRAREALGVRSRKKKQKDGHGPWMWSLPVDYSEAFAEFSADPTPEMKAVFEDDTAP